MGYTVALHLCATGPSEYLCELWTIRFVVGSGCQGEMPQPQESARRHLGLQNSMCCIHRQRIGIQSLCS